MHCPTYLSLRLEVGSAASVYVAVIIVGSSRLFEYCGSAEQGSPNRTRGDVVTFNSGANFAIRGKGACSNEAFSVICNSNIRA